MLDPEQDGVDPISVFCNKSSIPATGVLHHNLEEWTTVRGYEAAGSYNAKVWSGLCVLYVLSVLRISRTFWSIKVNTSRPGYAYMCE